MNPKPLTFLLSLTFLFLFSGFVFGQEPEVKREYWDNGKLRTEYHFMKGLVTDWYKSGKKESESHYKNGKLDGLATIWYQDGGR